MSTHALLELRGVSKRFRSRGIGARGGAGSGFLAVTDVSFSIPRSSIFGLVGESGCGKTTLARAVLYLDPPTAGTVMFDSTDLGSLGAKALRHFRRRMQIVFQDPNGALNPSISVRKSLGEGLENIGEGKRAVERRIDEVCDEVGVPSSHLNRRPAEFSGGEKQRLVIARALTMSPEFLVLDEPVSNLDVSVQAQMVNLLTDLKNRLDLTYLFISHDLNLIGYMSDYVGVMYGGHMVEIGSAEEILEAPLHPYTRSLFATTPQLSNQPPTGSASGAGCVFASECPLRDEACLGTGPPFQWLGPNRGVACFRV